MNVTTAAVSFDDGAVGIELFDRAAAVPERGSPGLPPEGLRPAAPGSQSLRNLWCGFFFLKIYIYAVPCLHVPSTIQTGLAARDGLFESGEKTKNLERGFFGLRRLQPLEIPQNG